MKGKMVWLGGVLIICAAAAAWLLRGPSSDSQGSAPVVGGEERPGLAQRAPSPGTVAPPGGSAAPARDQAQTNGGTAAAAAPPRPAPPQAATRRGQQGRDLEFIAKLFAPPAVDASEQDRALWDQSPVSDLLYPPDHPCAGSPRDSVSPELLREAGNEALANMIDSNPNVDAKQCHLEGNWPFHPLNQAYARVKLDDPQTVDAFIAELTSMPQDPEAYPASIWLPCPDRSDATTMREHFQGLVAEQVEQVFAGPPCTAP